MGRIVFLTDRSPLEALPGLDVADVDVKTQPLSLESVLHVGDLAPSAVIVDAEVAPDHAHRILRSIPGTVRAPVIVLLAPTDLERHPWHGVADDLLFPAAGAAEIRTRLSMLHRRTGGAGDAIVAIGPLTIDTESYQVVVAGRILDLTYKEFELLRFLVQRPGRAFSRRDLLREVWGFDFYGGTRTVDVHVRRLRAKLGPEHESLIHTVRGVGYRASEPADRS